MYFLSPYFCIVIYVIAVLSAYLINTKSVIGIGTSRFESIDGLRGFLAIGVFIHHASAWGQYFLQGNWDVSSSNLYSQFGQVSVSFFFMITSFLFITKLLESSQKQFNWRHFFISRAYRLIPMYFVSVALLVTIVMSLDKWHLNVSLFDFIVSIVHWLLFTLFKTSHINGAHYTSMIYGGVQWSLWYEWLFYLSLPWVSIFILKVKPQIFYLLGGIIFIVVFYQYRGIDIYHICSFIAGGISAVLLKFTSVLDKINDVYKSIIVVVALFGISQFNSINSVSCIFLIFIAFALIASGCTLLGVLKQSALKLLGTISYSTYLLHCILLHSTFLFVFTFDRMKQYSPLQYCLIIFSLVPILVLISFLCYKYIEKPFIDKGKKVVS